MEWHEATTGLRAGRLRFFFFFFLVGIDQNEIQVV